MRPLATLTGLSTVTSPAAPAFQCKFTLVWTSAWPCHVAVSEGLHANMASIKATSGKSTSRAGKMQHYTESLMGNSASHLAVAHVLVMRDRGLFPHLGPGSTTALFKGTGRRFLGRGTSPQQSFAHLWDHLSKVWYTQTLLSAEIAQRPCTSLQFRVLTFTCYSYEEIKLPIFFCSLGGAEGLWVIQPALPLLKLTWLKICNKHQKTVGGERRKSGYFLLKPPGFLLFVGPMLSSRCP